MTIDPRAIRDFVQEIQTEFDKNPVQVSVRADPDAVVPPPSSVTYNGTVVISNGDNARIDVDSEFVGQVQNIEVAPGYEALTALLTALLDDVEILGLPDREVDDIRESVDVVLHEAVKDVPDDGAIRQAVKLIKGSLAPIAAGVAGAVSAKSMERAKQLIDQLGTLLT